MDMEEVGVRVIAKSICQAREFIVYAKWSIATLNLHDKLWCLCRHSAMATHALDWFVCLFDRSLPPLEEVEHGLSFVNSLTLDTYVVFHDAGIIPFMLNLCQTGTYLSELSCKRNLNGVLLRQRWRHRVRTNHIFTRPRGYTTNCCLVVLSRLCYAACRCAVFAVLWFPLIIGWLLLSQPPIQV